MNLQIFKTLWGHQGDIQDACDQAVAAGFNGIEGQAPKNLVEQTEWKSCLDSCGLSYIAEIVTGGDYVPTPLPAENHLDDLRRGLEASMPLSPIFATTLCGSDRWPLAEAVKFYEQVIQLSKDYNITISIETHRSRPTFNPWQTRQLLEALPELKLTCDFSHWCVVTERLIMDEEPELLDLITSRFHHVHARVGYAQGPQVPHPNAPEHQTDLIAHTRWWKTLWDASAVTEKSTFTLTPEFGPDGYLQATPFTQEPVGDLWEINQWMGSYLQEVFSKNST